MSRACGGKLEDGVGVVRGGGGDDADTAASEVLQTVVDEPRSCTDQDFAKKTPDQVRGAAARGAPARTWTHRKATHSVRMRSCSIVAPACFTTP